MTEESESGLAYLLALKGPATETSPSPQESTPAGRPQQDGEKFSGPEKRRSRRFQCEGSVDIRAEGSVVRTWASFSDISLHGCYVEAQATYPVGSLLHMKLDANGIRVESHGIVRVSYPYLAMGISFADMTPQSTAELRRLLATVSRPNLIMGAGTASSLPSTAREAAPAVNDPAAALQALVEFFDSRQMLMRDDFLRILKQSGK